jgi:hypothetical protein
VRPKPRVIMVGRKRSGAQSVPKRRERASRNEAAQSTMVDSKTLLPSHFPPRRTTTRQPPSNVWGVGYRLTALR